MRTGPLLLAETFGIFLVEQNRQRREEHGHESEAATA